MSINRHTTPYITIYNKEARQMMNELRTLQKEMLELLLRDILHIDELCSCPMAIGNPMYNEHTKSCLEKKERILDLRKQLKEGK